MHLLPLPLSCLIGPDSIYPLYPPLNSFSSPPPHFDSPSYTSHPPVSSLRYSLLSLPSCYLTFFILSLLYSHPSNHVHCAPFFTFLLKIPSPLPSFLPYYPYTHRPSKDREAYYKRQQRENILNSLIEGASLSTAVLSSKQVAPPYLLSHLLLPPPSPPPSTPLPLALHLHAPLSFPLSPPWPVLLLHLDLYLFIPLIVKHLQYIPSIPVILPFHFLLFLHHLLP